MRPPRLWWCLFLLCIPSMSLAQAPVPANPSQPADVSSRLNQLESETQALRAEVQGLRDHPVRLPAVDATPTAMTPRRPWPRLKPS